MNSNGSIPGQIAKLMQQDKAAQHEHRRIKKELQREESAEHASHSIRKAVLSQGLFLSQQPLILHSNNGSPMKGATMLQTFSELEFTSSRSSPRVSTDNPYSESMFRTCKYRSDYPLKGFVSLEKSSDWCLTYVQWYRLEQYHSGIGFVRPSQVHLGVADKILEQTRQVYELARKKNPLR